MGDGEGKAEYLYNFMYFTTSEGDIYFGSAEKLVSYLLPPSAMPTAVPIAFPNQQRHGSGSNDVTVDNPIMISPNLQWRGSPMSMSYSILARSFGKSGQSLSAMMGTPGSFNAAFSE